jgi:hypothetical protein
MAFSYSRQLTFDRTKCGSANLSNFPALISIANSGFGAHVNSTSGFDIAFATDRFGASLLPWEMEPAFDKTTGKLIAWVKLANLNGSAAGSNSSIYMCYGDPAISSALNIGAAGPTNVWDTDFIGVAHLGNGTTALIVTDSTANGNNLALSATPPTPAAGQIDGCASFPGVDGVQLTAASSPFAPTRITFSAWINFSTFSSPNNYITIEEDAGGSSNHTMLVKSTGKLAVYLSMGSYDGTGVSTLALNTWYHICYTYDGANLVAYVNGSVDKTTPMTGNLTAAGGAQYFGGYHLTGRAFGGKIDEIRVSRIARSASWILSEHNNQRNPGNIGADNFVIFGPEVPLGRQPMAAIL